MSAEEKRALLIKGEVTAFELAEIIKRLRCSGCGADPPPSVVIVKQPQKGKEQTDPTVIQMMVDHGLAPPEEGKPRTSILGLCERCGRESGLIEETGDSCVGGRDGQES